MKQCTKTLLNTAGMAFYSPNNIEKRGLNTKVKLLPVVLVDYHLSVTVEIKFDVVCFNSLCLEKSASNNSVSFCFKRDEWSKRKIKDIEDKKPDTW